MSKENNKPWSLFGNGIPESDKEPRFPGVSSSWRYDPDTNNYLPTEKDPTENSNNINLKIF